MPCPRPCAGSALGGDQDDGRDTLRDVETILVGGEVAAGMVLLGAVFAVVIVWLSRLKRAASAAVRERVGDRSVLMDDQALSFGVESRGMMQARGTGCLAATQDEIVFVMWVGGHEIVIPRRDVTSVETPRSHLGKSQGVRLLKVRYEAEGRSDSVAWRVRDLDAWLAELSGGAAAGGQP